MIIFQKSLLFLGLFVPLVPVLPQSYVIGLQDVVFPTASTITLQMSTGITLSYVSVSLNDAPNISALTTERQRLSDLNLDYLIYAYNQTASLISNNMFALNQRIMPYLVLPDIVPDPITNTNMFYFDSQFKMDFDATKALLFSLNASSVVYIDYGPSPTSSNLIYFSNFTMTLTTVTTGPPWPPLLQNIFINNTQRFYICAIPLAQTPLITSLLNEAMFKGQLNPGNVWIFNSVTSTISDFNLFQIFSKVGANIYSFGINYATNVQLSNLATLQPYAAREYIRMIAQSINNTIAKPPNATQTLLNSLLPLGELVVQAGFNTTTHKLNGTSLSVLKVNVDQTPLQRFIYTNGIISAYNPTGTILNLNDSSITIRIGVILSNSYFMQNSKGDYYGFSVAVLNELLKLSNFKYVYVFPNDSVTGEITNRSDAGVSYAGIIRLMNQSLVDMSIIPMIPNNILGVVYPSNTIMQTKMNMIIAAPDKEVDYTIVLTPFTYNVWLGILLIMLIMTFGFWSINKISPNHSKECHKSKLEKYSFSYSFLIIYSSFVTAKLKIKPKQPSLYIFAFILWFSTLMFVLTYTSNMLPFMMQPATAFPFSQAANLTNLSTSSYKWGFVRNTIDTDVVQNDSVLKAIYNLALTNWPNITLYDDLTVQSALIGNKFIIIQSDRKNGYIYNKLCNSTLITGTNTQYSMVFPMSNVWSQRFQMNNLITQLINSGTINAVVNRYYNLGFCARSQDGLIPIPQVLSLNTTAGIFMIPLIGVLLGISCVMLIIAFNKIQRFCVNKKMNKFVYGDTYEAVVSRIDHDGVWAMINKRVRPYFVSSSSLHPDLRRTFTPQQLGIKPNDVLKLKYFGKDPVNEYKRFCREMDENEA